MDELTEDDVRNIVDDMISDHLSTADFITDYDASEIAENVFRDMCANGELGETEKRLSNVEREIRELNYWKADRHHDHSAVLERHWAEICELRSLWEKTEAEVVRLELKLKQKDIFWGV